MKRTEAIKRIAEIDKQIDANRRADNCASENRLFALRGWYQMIRDTADDTFASGKTDHARAVAMVAAIAKAEGRQ